MDIYIVFVILILVPILLLGSVKTIIETMVIINQAKKKYTKILNVKCIRTDWVEMPISTTHYDSDDNDAVTYTKMIKVNRPTYSCYYEGHSRCFCMKYLDYKPQAIAGNQYTIYLNPNDPKYRDFVDEFFYMAKKARVLNYVIFGIVCILILLMTLMYIINFMM